MYVWKPTSRRQQQLVCVRSCAKDKIMSMGQPATNCLTDSCLFRGRGCCSSRALFLHFLGLHYIRRECVDVHASQSGIGVFVGLILEFYLILFLFLVFTILLLLLLLYQLIYNRL